METNREASGRYDKKAPPDTDHMFTLKVDNVYRKTTKEMLQDEFGKFGEVGDVYVPQDIRSLFFNSLFTHSWPVPHLFTSRRRPEQGNQEVLPSCVT